jgi:hypothetical protein
MQVSDTLTIRCKDYYCLEAREHIIRSGKQDSKKKHPLPHNEHHLLVPGWAVNCYVLLFRCNHPNHTLSITYGQWSF